MTSNPANIFATNRENTVKKAFLTVFSLLVANILAGLLVIAVIVISVSKLFGYFPIVKRLPAVESVS